jgi:ABC-2 type transport system ATP-binding protein
MDEVEHCNRIAMMHAGKIIREGTIAGIKKAVFAKPILEIEADSPVEAYKALSGQKEKLGDISIHGALIHVIPSLDTAVVRENMKTALQNASLGFSAPEEVEPTMDDVFVNLVKRYESNAAG